MIPSGTAITTGSNNVIVGAHAGTAAMTNTVVLADGAGTVRARWDNTANAVLGLDASVPSLTVNDTMSMYRDTATGGLNVAIRSGGVTHTLELRNERQIGTALSAATSLSSAHRNRFTQVTAVATITLVAYTGIVLGSEHEFMSRAPVPSAGPWHRTPPPDWSPLRRGAVSPFAASRTNSTCPPTGPPWSSTSEPTCSCSVVRSSEQKIIEVAASFFFPARVNGAPIGTATPRG